MKTKFSETEKSGLIQRINDLSKANAKRNHRYAR